MSFINTTGDIKPYVTPHIVGVMLPYSSQVLDSEAVKRKIATVENVYRSLSQQTANRKTHGGKRFRARNISLHRQLMLVSERRSVLYKAREMIAFQEAVQFQHEVARILRNIQLLSAMQPEHARNLVHFTAKCIKIPVQN